MSNDTAHCVVFQDKRNIGCGVQIIFQKGSVASWDTPLSSQAGRHTAGGNEASCVSSLIWELNNFPCGTAISSFRLYSTSTSTLTLSGGWKGESKTSNPAVRTRCHCQSTVPHTDLRLAAVQTERDLLLRFKRYMQFDFKIKSQALFFCIYF